MITFKPNCTFPDESPNGFVNGPNIRSTMQIVWSCVAIIILSTWSILHLNIPPDFREQNAWQSCLQKLYSTSRKALWMIVMFVAPEGWTSLCALKRFTARHNNKILEDLANQQEVPWSRTHTVFADMGGFAICFSDKELYSTPQKKPSLLQDFRESLSIIFQKIKEGKISQTVRLLRTEPDFIERFDCKQRLFFGWFGKYNGNSIQNTQQLQTPSKKGYPRTVKTLIGSCKISQHYLGMYGYWTPHNSSLQ